VRVPLNGLLALRGGARSLSNLESKTGYLVDVNAKTGRTAFQESENVVQMVGGHESGATQGCVTRAPLFVLGPELVKATVVRRPSERNKSPFVGDVRLAEDGRIALAHMPSLDLGGKCIAGSEVLLKAAVDRKGQPVGATATGKYGTPKCEFIMQLLRVNEPENAHLGGCWVGAHPSIGEKATAALLRNGALDASLATTVTTLRQEVSNPAGCDMRCDVEVTGSDGKSRTVIEVKTVVDSDYDPATPPPRLTCVFFGPSSPYSRAAIFPWGKARQRGPSGEKVVSARAIKHLDQLAAIARGHRTLPDGTLLSAALVFIVVRPDALSFRPNTEACPSFAKHLQAAKAAGVRVLARRIGWSDSGSGEAFDLGDIPVDLCEEPNQPTSSSLSTGA
jgi:DNA-binding sugar fermentation-stimulating protein